MRILITGHKGFIGQNMVKALSDHDLDLCDWGDKYSLTDVDRVIHLGAISDTRCQDWDALHKQNVRYSIDLMDECQDRRIPIQISSSASVYGLNNTTFRETDTVAPANLYAESKVLVENHLHQMNPVSPVQLFRYFNVYGPYESHKGDQASPFHKFNEQAKTGTVKIFDGSDEFRRDFIHVDKVIQTHKAFFDVDESGIWNVGTGKTLSFKDVASLMSAKYSANIEYIKMPEGLQAAYQKFTCANTTKLERSLVKS